MASPAWRVPLSDIVIEDELLAATHDAVASSWWSMGPRVAEFERAVGEFCRVEHSFAVSSCTAALHLALLALGCGDGDEVVLPSLTFVAAANTVALTGATPVFCDVLGEDDLNLDPDDLEAALSPNTRAIVAFHYGGFACDMSAVTRLAEERGIAVIEDAAHALGATWQGRACGSLGDVGCFSFFSNKNVPIGEGGMLVTNDSELAERVRLLRSHGMTTLTWDRHRGHASSYDVVTEGLNYRFDEVRSAIGLVQLARLPERNTARAAVSDRYLEHLHGVGGLTVPFRSREARSSSAHHLAVVVLPDSVERDSVRDSMARAGIQTSIHYPPIHRFTAYSRREPSRVLPRTDGLAGRILTLPLFPHLTGDQVDVVVGTLVETLTSA
jgi:dTDP-4-amino-4,6-dideoxygalactose transaminase